MRSKVVLLPTTAMLAAGVVLMTSACGGAAAAERAPVSGVTLPAGYRDWKLISVAHEEGDLNDLRAILGNDVAIAACREGKTVFPDGSIIARLAWTHTPSEEN